MPMTAEEAKALKPGQAVTIDGSAQHWIVLMVSEDWNGRLRVDLSHEDAPEQNTFFTSDQLGLVSVAATEPDLVDQTQSSSSSVDAMIQELVEETPGSPDQTQPDASDAVQPSAGADQSSADDQVGDQSTPRKGKR